MQFYYQFAILLSSLSQTLAAPAEQAVEDKQITKRACAPTGQESCCLKGVNGAQTNLQELIPFGSNGGIINGF
ncbi:predicted protein [Pyrenophora tritici-repentis Pt-1C-BFP]|uniref:Uncharacterized protein n=1 Tax=Pyrenophora tritici-repentis (strain Pt-1C-BFP) TaxID=426418 RepID=B2WHH2_PYRTR|nr:uncharacterized protein PTRG_09431 [Pyrenophora tritici-repentis Pt-1C-BFP]EDU42482.1 predicted protein [Pyrenophora tritici-repentis Pt-1C-BFP]